MAHGELSLQLQQSEQQNQTLYERLESQKVELAEQRERSQEMQAVVLSLRNQLTILRHQATPVVSQNGTDQEDLMECISALRKEVRQMKEDNRRRSLSQSSQQHVMPSQFDITTPVNPVNHGQFQQGSPFVYPQASVHVASPFVSPNQSACAGYVPVNFMNVPPKKPRPPGPLETPSSSSSSSGGDGGKGKGGESPPSTHDPSWPGDPGDGSGNGGSPIARSQHDFRSVVQVQPGSMMSRQYLKQKIFNQ